MKRVIVIGCPGSGKSYFAKKLQVLTQLPLVHLDLLNWNSDRTTVSKEEFNRRLEEKLNMDSWIIDKNYGSTMEKRMRLCDTIFFLDYPVEQCLKGISERSGKSRTDMPWIETEDSIEPDFINFIKDFKINNSPEIERVINKYPIADCFRFKTREESEKFLKSILNF